MINTKKIAISIVIIAFLVIIGIMIKMAYEKYIVVDLSH